MFAVREQSAKVADAVVAAQPQTQGALQPALRRVMRASLNPNDPPPGGTGITVEQLTNGDLIYRYFREGRFFNSVRVPLRLPFPINSGAPDFVGRGIAVNVADFETPGPDPKRDYTVP